MIAEAEPLPPVTPNVEAKPVAKQDHLGGTGIEIELEGPLSPSSS